MVYRVRPFAFAIFLAVASFAQKLPDPAPPASPYIDPDAYEVYSALIPLTPIYKAAKMLVIRRETVPTNDLGPPRGCLHGDKQFQDENAELFENYDRANKAQWLLDPAFTFDKPFDFVSKDDFLPSNPPPDPWARFFRRYPDSGGYVTLSAVGFNAEKSVAVVYLGTHCGRNCASGSYHMLEKREGDWQEMPLIEPSCSSSRID